VEIVTQILDQHGSQIGLAVLTILMALSEALPQFSKYTGVLQAVVSLLTPSKRIKADDKSAKNKKTKE
jgi:hypothetical protein